MSDKILYLCYERIKTKEMEHGKIDNFVKGLYIQNGELRNMRPNGMSGIEEASMYRQQMKKQYKIDCICLLYTSPSPRD